MVMRCLKQCQIMVSHCNSGVHRSPQVVAMMLAVTEDITYAEAETWLKTDLVAKCPLCAQH